MIKQVFLVESTGKTYKTVEEALIAEAIDLSPALYLPEYQLQQVIEALTTRCRIIPRNITPMNVEVALASLTVEVDSKESKESNEGKEFV